MSDNYKILILIAFNLLTVMYVYIFRKEIKSGGFIALQSPSKAKLEDLAFQNIRNFKLFIGFMLAFQFILYCIFFNILTIYRYINGYSLFDN